MHIDQLRNAQLSIEEAVKKIEAHTEYWFIWFAVKTPKNCHIELGGRANKGLELKASIPIYNGDKLVIYPNGFVQYKYSISSNGLLYLPEANLEIPGEWGVEKMIKFLKTKDFKTYSPRIEEYEEIIKETKLRLKSL